MKNLLFRTKTALRRLQNFVVLFLSTHHILCLCYIFYREWRAMSIGHILFGECVVKTSFFLSIPLKLFFSACGRWGQQTVDNRPAVQKSVGILCVRCGSLWTKSAPCSANGAPQYLVVPRDAHRGRFPRPRAAQSARPIASDTGSDSTRPQLRVFMPTARVSAAMTSCRCSLRTIRNTISRSAWISMPKKRLT